MTAVNERHKRVLEAFSTVCATAGLTPIETIILGAYFTGATIAAHPARTAHKAQLEVATNAMQDAYTTVTLGRAARETIDPR